MSQGLCPPTPGQRRGRRTATRTQAEMAQGRPGLAPGRRREPRACRPARKEPGAPLHPGRTRAPRSPFTPASLQSCSAGPLAHISKARKTPPTEPGAQFQRPSSLLHPSSLRSGQGQYVLLGHRLLLAQSCTQATPCSGRSANLQGNPIPDKGLGSGCPSNQPGSRGALPPGGRIPAPAVPVTCSGPGYFYP